MNGLWSLAWVLMELAKAATAVLVLACVVIAGLVALAIVRAMTGR